MTKHEKDALINYMDGQLMTLCQALKPHIDPDAVGTLYEEVYAILHDLQETIITQGAIPYPATKKTRR
jgi:hypothetical protein